MKWREQWDQEPWPRIWNNLLETQCLKLTWRSRKSWAKRAGLSDASFSPAIPTCKSRRAWADSSSSFLAKETVTKKTNNIRKEKIDLRDIIVTFLLFSIDLSKDSSEVVKIFEYGLERRKCRHFTAEKLEYWNGTHARRYCWYVWTQISVEVEVFGIALHVETEDLGKVDFQL